MFYCLGPGVQYLADNRLLLDPLVSPLHPLQLHLPRRLGAHQEVKGKSRSNPHGTITPRSLARVFDPADIDRIGILVNIAPIRLQEEEKKKIIFSGPATKRVGGGNSIYFLMSFLIFTASKKTTSCLCSSCSSCSGCGGRCCCCCGTIQTTITLDKVDINLIMTHIG